MIRPRVRPGGTPQLRPHLRAALGALALLGAGLAWGCAPVAAQARVPVAAAPASYRSLYVGLVRSDVAPPPLLAETTISALEPDFPPTSPAQLNRELRGLGPQLYLGLTLARLSCRDDYLAQLTYGPGPRLTLTVAQRQLPPRTACFELIGPVMYQVVALPRSQFPSHLTLSIVVKRPLGSPEDQTSLRLP